MMRLAALAFLLAAFGGVASASEYWASENSDVIGEVQVIKARYEDTFVALARQYDVGFEALREANPDVDPWLPGEGTEIVIPTRFVLPRAPHTGIVVNVAELRLYYFPSAPGTPPEGADPNDRRVVTHPISIGRMDWSTPIGTTKIVSKVANPAWYPPESIREEHAANNEVLPRVVPPGPDNPLGKHALRLGLPGYLIHGTNKPSGVGMRVTHGCIRLFPEDIEALFKTVPTGTPVHIVNQPYKLGWGPDGLYLEAHPMLEEHAAAPMDMTEFTRLFVAATEERRSDVNWDLAEKIMREARGIPAFVSVSAIVAWHAGRQGGRRRFRLRRQ